MGGKHHGMSQSPTYNSWSTMIQRCTNPKNTHYAYYGGRGIKVYPRWLDFKMFLADIGERPEGTTLDRVDNGGHYSPNNCRWVSRKVQALNRRSNVFHIIGGVTKTTTEWLAHFNIKQSTFDQRVYVYKWSIIKAFTTPVRKRG